MLKLKEESIEPIDEFSAYKVETGQKQSIASVLALQVTTTAVCSGWGMTEKVYITATYVLLLIWSCMSKILNWALYLTATSGGKNKNIKMKSHPSDQQAAMQ